MVPNALQLWKNYDELLDVYLKNVKDLELIEFEPQTTFYDESKLKVKDNAFEIIPHGYKEVLYYNFLTSNHSSSLRTTKLTLKT